MLIYEISIYDRCEILAYGQCEIFVSDECESYCLLRKRRKSFQIVSGSFLDNSEE